MSVPMYSDGAETIHRQISNEDKDLTVNCNLELDRCVKWITKHNFSRVNFLPLDSSYSFIVIFYFYIFNFYIMNF